VRPTQDERAVAAATDGEVAMAKRQDERGVGRRGFLGAIAGLSAGAAIAGTIAAPAAATETADERVKARYQETDHVKAFYATNRYETKDN
jgi:uncharacterized protein YcfJ